MTLIHVKLIFLLESQFDVNLALQRDIVLLRQNVCQLKNDCL